MGVRASKDSWLPQPALHLSIMTVCLLLASTVTRASDLIQQQSATAVTQSSITVNLPSAVLPGDALIVTIANDAVYAQSVAGGGITAGGWTLAAQSCAHECSQVWYGLHSNGSSSSVVVTFSQSADISVNVSEYSGVTGVDKVVNANGASTSVSPGSLNLARKYDLIIEAAGIHGASISGGPASGFTALAAGNNPAGYPLLETAYFTTSTPTGTYSTTWTLPQSEAWDALAVAFTGNNIVQESIGSAADSASLNLTLSAAPQDGDALVLSIVDGANYATSVSGGGVTWTRAAGSCEHECVEIWYGLNSNGSNRAVEIAYPSAGDITGEITELAGIAGLDTTGANNDGTSTDVSTSTVTPANANDFLLASAGINGSTVTNGPSGAWSALGSTSPAPAGTAIEPAYAIVTQTGAFSTSWTLSSATGWDTVIAAFELSPLVQQATGTSSGSSTVSVSLPSNPAAGDALVLSVTNGGGQTVSSVSGGGTSWTRAGASCDHVCTELWYGLDSSGSGKVITVTYGGATNAAANVSEFSGINGFDGFTSGYGVSTTASTDSLSTTNANDVLVGTAGIDYTSISGGPSNSFIPLASASAGSDALLEGAYDVSTSSGSLATGWTVPEAVGWDSGILALKTATAFSQAVQSSPQYYGPGINMVSLNNFALDSAAEYVDYTFTAQQTGSINTLMPYFVDCKIETSNPCTTGSGLYGSGDGAELQVDVYPDNGSGEPDMGAQPLGSITPFWVCGGGAITSACRVLSNTFRELDFEQAVSVVAGTEYHIVFRNIASDPTTNFSSLDEILSPASLTCPNVSNAAQPTFAPSQLGILRSSDGGSTWGPASGNSCNTPIVDLTYSNGFHQGNGYTDVGEFTAAIGGSDDIVREVFTVGGSSKTVNAVSVFVNLVSGSEGLWVALQNSSGTVLAKGQAMPNSGSFSFWRTYQFSSPVTLQSGQTYQLVLTATSTYSAQALENGSQNGEPFSSDTVWSATGAEAQFSTNGGSTWTEWEDDGAPGEVADLMFYFTLQ